MTTETATLAVDMGERDAHYRLPARRMPFGEFRALYLASYNRTIAERQATIRNSTPSARDLIGPARFGGNGPRSNRY